MRYITQIALPKVLRLDALKHDSLAGGGHLGIEKVRASLIQRYFWPRMHQDIVDYVKSCSRCQFAKRNYNPVKPPMQPMPARERFECWQIDILTPLHKSPEGYEYILLCIDAGTHWPEAFPLKSQNAKEVANVLFENIFARYGAPSILFSDRGRNFMSKLINALCEIFDISRHHTSAYHPNTNGLVERQNSVIAQSLRVYCDKDRSRGNHRYAVKLENALEYKAPKNPVLVTTCRYVFGRHFISVKNENNLKVISCVAHNDCIFIMG